MELSEVQKLRVVELKVNELYCEKQEDKSRKYVIQESRIKNRYNRFLSSSLEIKHFRSIAFDKNIFRRGSEEFGFEEYTDVFIVLDIFSKKFWPKMVKEIYNKGFYVYDGKTYKHYVEYKRNANNAKNGKHVFILEKYYDKMMKWSWMNDKTLLTAINAEDEEKDAGLKLSLTDAKAYECLVRSGIIGLAKIEPEQILVVKDIKHAFQSDFWIADIVKDNNENLDVVYRDPNQESTGKTENDVFDGECLIDTAVFENNTEIFHQKGQSADKAMMLLRNHFFKSCGFRTRIQDYYKEYFKKVSPDVAYEDIKLKDCFGNTVYAKDVRMIVTENSCKFLKFSHLYKKETELKSKNAIFKTWKKAVKADGCLFGIVEFDERSSKNPRCQWTYQMINSIPLSESEVRTLAEPSLEFYKELKEDLETYKVYVGGKVVERMDELPTSTDMFLLKMLSYNEAFSQTEIFKEKRYRDCEAYLKKLRRGKIKIDANYSVLCSMPFELLQWSLIPQGDNKKSLKTQEEWIANLKPVLDKGEVYQANLEQNQQVTLCRNPHVYGGNIVAAKNKKVLELGEWFYFNMPDNPRDIIVVSPWEWDIMNALNGADFDSDTVLCICNNIVNDKVRKTIYYNNKRLFPIPHDATGKAETKKAFYHDYSQLYEIDKKLAQNYIGEIIDYSQILNSYLMNRFPKEEKALCDEKYLQMASMSLLVQFYLDQIVKLSVLSGIEIDKAKHVSSIDSIKELCNCRPEIADGYFVYEQEGTILWTTKEVYDEDKQEEKDADEKVKKDNIIKYYGEVIYDVSTMEPVASNTGYREVMEINKSKTDFFRFPQFMKNNRRDKRKTRKNKGKKNEMYYMQCPMDFLHAYIDEFKEELSVKNIQTKEEPSVKSIPTLDLKEFFDFKDVKNSNESSVYNQVYSIEKILYNEDTGVQAINKANMIIAKKASLDYDLKTRMTIESNLIATLQTKTMTDQIMEKTLYRVVTSDVIEKKRGEKVEYAIEPSKYGMIILSTLHKAWPENFENCVKKAKK